MPTEQINALLMPMPIREAAFHFSTSETILQCQPKQFTILSRIHLNIQKSEWTNETHRYIPKLITGLGIDYFITI